MFCNDSLQLRVMDLLAKKYMAFIQHLSAKYCNESDLSLIRQAGQLSVREDFPSNSGYLEQLGKGSCLHLF